MLTMTLRQLASEMKHCFRPGALWTQLRRMVAIHRFLPSPLSNRAIERGGRKSLPTTMVHNRMDEGRQWRKP